MHVIFEFIMIKNISFILLSIILFSREFYSQQNDNLITVVGKKMIGKTVDGEAIREVLLLYKGTLG